jgi:hypothetical protein
VEALRAAEGEAGAAEHALERPHQVVVTEEAEVAAFLEADADLRRGGEGWG